MDRTDLQELVKDYREDGLEFLQEIESILLQVEQDAPNRFPVTPAEQILSYLHTLKGNSGMMDFRSIQSFIHVLEDFFKLLPEVAPDMVPKAIEWSFHNCTIVRNSITAISSETMKSPDLQTEHEELTRALELLREHRQTAMAEEFSPKSSQDVIAPVTTRLEVIKVDFDRMDALLNLMGELVIHRTRLSQLEKSLRQEVGAKQSLLELQATIEQIGKVSTELHEAIMKVRMMKLKHVFMRFPRFVRDLAKEKGKDVSLQIIGAETELDKTVIDEIGEPLVHILTNAVDHGIEMPSEREATGKSRRGTITLRAYQESNQIIITIEDDGRGINVKQLRERATQLRLLEVDEIRRDINDLIFYGGLSTSGTVTNTSGRGVGLDVVRKSLAKIGGTIDVSSEESIGTRFTIKLPLTLAIISALIVVVEDELYAIPLASVLEIIKIDARQLHIVNHRPVVKIRNRVIPLIDLKATFSLQGRRQKDRFPVVVVQLPAGQIGIIVDDFIEQQEIVIKSLGEYLGSPRGIAGATIQGNGRVVLIVDPQSLIETIVTSEGEKR